ncbi:NAD(+) synthetase, partial [Francisella tularensis subsp. holarctica]|nr:NAD(+) synthetase [Francisella tularensis subsp. holarctica]
MKIVKDFSPKEYSLKLVNWLIDICMNYHAEGFVIGLSGG